MEHIRELPNITKGANCFPAIFFYVNNSNNKSFDTDKKTTTCGIRISRFWFGTTTKGDGVQPINNWTSNGNNNNMRQALPVNASLSKIRKV